MNWRALIGTCVVIAVLIVVLSYFSHGPVTTVTVRVGKYDVEFSTAATAEKVLFPDTTFEGLTKNKLVSEISWSDTTSLPGIMAWYNWTPKRGFIHNGTLYKSSYELRHATKR